MKAFREQTLNNKHTDTDRSTISETEMRILFDRFDLGYTKTVEHVIKTPGELIMQNPRRQQVDEIISTLKKAGVIRRCQNPWKASIVIVGKKDGSNNMCVDYRSLNNITEKKSFPMPNINHLV